MGNASMPRPFRLDINDLAQSGPAFDLYIQALSELQRTNQDDPLSYYQIAGELH
jgi:tyrosinase